MTAAFDPGRAKGPPGDPRDALDPDEAHKPVQRPCRACGVQLLFVRGPNGKAIPLDMEAITYRVTTDLLGGTVCDRVVGAFVSHFSTCTSPANFSRGKKKR